MKPLLTFTKPFQKIIDEKEEQIHASNFGKLPIYYYYVHTTAHALIYIFYKFIKE